MHPGQVVVGHDPQLFESVFAGFGAPPEPDAVHLVVGSPEDRNPGVAQLPEIGNDRVHLCLPLQVEARAFCGQFLPYQLRGTVLPCPNRRTVAVVAFRREAAVPHQGDDPAFGVPGLDLFDEPLPQFFGRFIVRKALTPGRGEVHRAAVVVVADVVALCIETEIASPDHGVFARHCENDTVVTPGVADEIMLPGEGIPAADGL